MENRYETLCQVGVRNITGFHAKGRRVQFPVRVQQIHYHSLGVDELADLMMVASKGSGRCYHPSWAEGACCRYPHDSCNWRPSVDIISGLIKANVPISCLAFAVSSGTDSVRFWMKMEQKKLLGRGNMLFKPENHPVRLSSFISDDVDAL